MDAVLSTLEKDAFKVFTSFQNKCLKVNSGKPHLLTRPKNILHIDIAGRRMTVKSVVASMRNY